jgi:hypothetical protein
MAKRPHLAEAITIVREAREMPASEVPDEVVASLAMTQWTELGLALDRLRGVFVASLPRPLRRLLGRT